MASANSRATDTILIFEPSVFANAQGTVSVMTHSTIGTKVDQTLDGELDFTAQVTFDGVLGHGVAELLELSVVQVLDLLGFNDAARGEDLLGAGAADAIDGGQTDHDMLLRRNINTGDTSHCLLPH
jgi:hypothetical protein